MSEKEYMDIDGIRKILKQRYPFLMVDRILEIETGKKIRALKNVTINEPFFQGHFPERPVMPGIMMIEAMAQSGALLLILSDEDRNGKDFFLGGADKVRFRKLVRPGDQLIIDVEFLRKRSSISKVKARCSVDGELVSEGEFMAVMEKSKA